MDQQTVTELLREVIHPETGKDLVGGGILETVSFEDGRLSVRLAFPRARDPFATKLRRQVEQLLAERLPEYQGRIAVFVREGTVTHKVPEMSAKATPGGEKCRIVVIASGKGGVGKSTVAANLSVALQNAGYRVGLLDADIYGPSQPGMFGVEDYRPEAVDRDSETWIVPADVRGIRLQSIGFFIGRTDALVWRGPMATNALKQMIRQTDWGPLDFLLVDLPPGTGDVHLSVMAEMRIDGAVIVSTPQRVATADVIRGIRMFQTEGIDIPILGLIENMAWFTPAELPNNRYYIFGQGGARRLAEIEGINFLGDIPLIQSVREGGDEGTPAAAIDPAVEPYYREAALRIVKKVIPNVDNPIKNR